MDILSHGLWGGIAFGRENRKLFWWAFIIGILPDLLSFGIFTSMRVLGLTSGIDWSNGPPPDSSIPAYVHMLYNITHSLLIFALVFLIVWIVLKKPFLPLLAWGLHILMDIPTHSLAFFPTPFLWPLFSTRVNGIPWTHPLILIPDIVLLVILYVWFFVVRKQKENKGP